MKNGGVTDVTNKETIERAIMDTNWEKFMKSHYRPFYRYPLHQEFGGKGTAAAMSWALARVYNPKWDIPAFELEFLQSLEIPKEIWSIAPIKRKINIEQYCKFWEKVKETTSCFPDAFSLATMKARAHNERISEIEYRLTRILLLAGYALSHWKRCMDVMILKKSGITKLSGLWTVV
jgi:hypothetical protein